MNQSFLSRYQDHLSSPLQRGEGCHNWMMTTANYGILAKLSGDQVFSDIRRELDRRVPDSEIIKTVKTAIRDHGNGTFTPTRRPDPIVRNGKAARQRIIEQAKISDEADLWEASPIRIDWEPSEDAARFLGGGHV